MWGSEFPTLIENQVTVGLNIDLELRNELAVLRVKMSEGTCGTFKITNWKKFNQS